MILVQVWWPPCVRSGNFQKFFAKIWPRGAKNQSCPHQISVFPFHCDQTLTNNPFYSHLSTYQSTIRSNVDFQKPMSYVTQIFLSGPHIHHNALTQNLFVPNVCSYECLSLCKDLFLYDEFKFNFCPFYKP